MATPKLYDTEVLKAVDLKEGDIFKIMTEFDDPTKVNPKFQGFLMGKVGLRDGSTKYLSVSKSSYRQISAEFGSDTKAWINKFIQYEGEKRYGAMMGKSFIPYNSKDLAGQELPDEMI